jgi:hypothetical protein
MKKPLLHALPLSFGLPLLALLLSLSPQHPSLTRPITPSPRNDTTPPATLQVRTSQVTLRLYPVLLQGHYTNLNLEWQSTVNGLPGQKGALLHRNLSPTGPTSIVLPLRIPPTNDEMILHVTGRLASTPGNKQNAPLFTTYLPLRPWRGDHSIPAAGDLSFTDSNNIFTINASKTLVQFDKQTGWLLHYAAGGAILMGDTAGLRSDLGPSDTLEPHLQLFFASTGAQIVIVRAEYTLPAIDCLLHLSYTINAAGDMLVEQTLETDTSGSAHTDIATGDRPDTATSAYTDIATAHPDPTLPRFGMTWILPQGLDSVSWYGAGDQGITVITPPVKLARETGSLTGVPNATSPIFPGVRWLALKGRSGQGLRIIADSSLLQLKVLPTDTMPGQLHPQGLALGIYGTMYPTTQRRFTYSYKVVSQR